MSFVYLASPYSHADPAMRQDRFDAVCKYASQLMLDGVSVFSPIAHSHPIESHFPEIRDFDFWMKQDIPILCCASKLIVLRLAGWDKSRGVAREMEVARTFGIPTEFVDP